jgi:hypothetical protein
VSLPQYTRIHTTASPKPLSHLLAYSNTFPFMLSRHVPRHYNPPHEHPLHRPVCETLTKTRHGCVVSPRRRPQSPQLFGKHQHVGYHSRQAAHCLAQRYKGSLDTSHQGPYGAPIRQPPTQPHREVWWSIQWLFSVCAIHTTTKTLLPNHPTTLARAPSRHTHPDSTPHRNTPV